MSRLLLLALALVILTDCGIRKPLVAPKDQPAFEEKQRKKREKLEEDSDDATTTAPATPVDNTASPSDATSGPVVVTQPEQR